MEIRKRFYNFVIPSMLSFVLTGIYCFVDEFFVGNSVGDVGIATINIAFSYIALFGAVGCGIGIGASVPFTISRCQGDEEAAFGYLGTSTLLMVLFTFLFGLPILLFPKAILVLLGASSVISEIGIPYMQINALGAFFMIFASGWSPVVRNLGGARYSMVSVTAGIVVNMVLDWLFVWVLGYGLAGAAAASVLGQVLTFFLFLFFLLRRKGLRFGVGSLEWKSSLVRILLVGISPFGLTMAPNLSIVFINRASLAYGGDVALASYGVISYLVYIVMLVFQGVGDGSQPLVSEYFGKGDRSSLCTVERLTYAMALGVALVSFVLSWMVRYQMGAFMGSSDYVSQRIGETLPIFLIAFPFTAAARIKASNLYSKERNLSSYLITYLDPVLVLVGTLVFPRFFGQTGVWLSASFSQILVALAAFFLS